MALNIFNTPMANTDAATVFIFIEWWQR